MGRPLTIPMPSRTSTDLRVWGSPRAAETPTWEHPADNMAAGVQRAPEDAGALLSLPASPRLLAGEETEVQRG